MIIKLTALLLCAAIAWAENPVGTWRGESICQVKPSGCNDEHALYRVTAIGQSKDRVNLSGGKIVDGREVNMGSSECSYDDKTRALDCPLPNGSTIRLVVNGTTMEGRMTMRDGTFWRKISLHKDGE